MKVDKYTLNCDSSSDGHCLCLKAEAAFLLQNKSHWPLIKKTLEILSLRVHSINCHHHNVQCEPALISKASRARGLLLLLSCTEEQVPCPSTALSSPLRLTDHGNSSMILRLGSYFQPPNKTKASCALIQNIPTARATGRRIKEVTRAILSRPSKLALSIFGDRPH